MRTLKKIIIINKKKTDWLWHWKHVLLWKMKCVKVNTFIHSFRKWVHIISGLAQFKHPNQSLSQQKPLAEGSDEILMVDMLCWRVLGMTMIPKPQWGCDRMCTSLHLPPIQPLRGFCYWPVSQCPLMSEQLPDSCASRWQVMCDWIILTRTTACDGLLYLKKTGREGYCETARGKDYNTNPSFVAVYTKSIFIL